MEFKTMTLGQCAAFDHMSGAKFKMTAWGKICKEKHHENSRSQIRKRNQQERQFIIKSTKPKW